MKLETANSLLVARNVVNCLEMNLEHVPAGYQDTDTSGVTLHVGSFQNCREQGLTVSAFGVKLSDKQYGCPSYSISEDRCSDAIVVYVGEMVNNVSDERFALEQHYFSPGEYQKAADFILEDVFSKLVANG